MAYAGVQIRKRPKILLSSFDEVERRELSEKIRSIGGILYASSNYTSSATHIICRIPSRGEKFICACAAGKWILSRSYIDESVAQKKWLDEDSYEWSIEKAKEGTENRYLYPLPRKWRLRHESGAKAVFNGWIVVLIFTTVKKREGFKRLIEAGGGRVLTVKPPYRGLNMKKIKYVISENADAKELRPFNRAGVPILSPETVPDFIIKENAAIVSTASSLTSGTSSLSVPFPKKPIPSVDLTINEKNGNQQKQKDVSKTPSKQTQLKEFFIALKDNRGDYKKNTGEELKEEDIKLLENDAVESQRKDTRSATEKGLRRQKKDALAIQKFGPTAEKGLERRKRDTSRKCSKNVKASNQENVSEEHKKDGAEGLKHNLIEVQVKDSMDIHKTDKENVSSLKISDEYIKNNVKASSLLDPQTLVDLRAIDQEPPSRAKQSLNEAKNAKTVIVSSFEEEDLSSSSSKTKAAAISIEDDNMSSKLQQFRFDKALSLKPEDSSSEATPFNPRETISHYRASTFSPRIQLPSPISADVIVMKSPIKGGTKEERSDVSLSMIKEIINHDNNSFSAKMRRESMKIDDTKSTNMSRNSDQVDDIAISSISNISETKCDNREVDKRKKSREVWENLCDIDLTSSTTMTRNSRKKRSLEKACEVVESENLDSSCKKTKADTGEQCLIKDESMHFSALPSCLPLAAQKNEKDTTHHHCLHRSGVDSIEGRLEDDHFQIAVKMISLHLTPSCYLTPRVLYVVLKMLKDPAESFNLGTLSEISSLLNRYISLHPPAQLRKVYLSALGQPGLGINDEIRETGDPFSFLMETIREVRDGMKGENEEAPESEQSKFTKFLRKEARLSLLKFMIRVFETDYLHFYKSTGSSNTWKNRPILAQILWPGYNAIGGGHLLKEFLNVMIEITMDSLERRNLVPLKSLIFALLRIAAGCCEVSDFHSLETKYGPACSLFASELFSLISPLVKEKATRHRALRTILNALGSGWLAARLSDHVLSLYDVSTLPPEIRQSLSKPLSLEKIVSCYFKLVPKFQDCNYTPARKDVKKGKPLAVIGDSSSESSRLNSERKLTLKRNAKGETRLHVACIKNQPTVVKQLLCEGCNPNLYDNAGWTPLHEASNHGNEECVAELLKSRDINIFATAMGGLSVLHDAVANNHNKVVRMLLEYGGPQLLGMKTDLDKSALDFASNFEMKKLLETMAVSSKKAKVNSYLYRKKCPPEDIEDYLQMLFILLRFYLCPEQAEREQLQDKFKELNDHVSKLCKKPNWKIVYLLHMIENYICKI